MSLLLFVLERKPWLLLLLLLERKPLLLLLLLLSPISEAFMSPEEFARLLVDDLFDYQPSNYHMLIQQVALAIRKQVGGQVSCSRAVAIR